MQLQGMASSLMFLGSNEASLWKEFLSLRMFLIEAGGVLIIVKLGLQITASLLLTIVP